MLPETKGVALEHVRELFNSQQVLVIDLEKRLNTFLSKKEISDGEKKEFSQV
jgi:hypothetical protein